MRSRDLSVETRTRLVNHVHGLLKSFGLRVKKYAAPARFQSTRHRQVKGQIPEELQPAIQPLLDALAGIAAQVLAVDRVIRDLSTKAYPETALLSQVGGVGPLTALRYVLTIEDPGRIERSRNVGAQYLFDPEGGPSAEAAAVGKQRSGTAHHPRLETGTCAGRLSNAHSTSWVPSARTRT